MWLSWLPPNPHDGPVKEAVQLPRQRKGFALCLNAGTAPMLVFVIHQIYDPSILLFLQFNPRHARRDRRSENVIDVGLLAHGSLPMYSWLLAIRTISATMRSQSS
jgi:hypothetical protein